MTKIGPYIGGKGRAAQSYDTIRSPFDDSAVGEVGVGSSEDLELAIAGAAAAFREWSRSAAHQRALVLERLALAIDAEQAELARLITRESGKPIRYAKAEVA